MQALLSIHLRFGGQIAVVRVRFALALACPYHAWRLGAYALLHLAVQRGGEVCICPRFGVQVAFVRIRLWFMGYTFRAWFYSFDAARRDDSRLC